MTVTWLSRIIWRRAPVESPPVGMQRWPIDDADSNAAQKPMKGPKEKVKMNRSAGSMPMAAKMMPQQRCSHFHDCGVSSQRTGRPEEPEVWWKRVYCAAG